MPIPLMLAAAGIMGGASLLGTGANMYMQNQTNQVNADLAREMYNKQRQDALTDYDKTNRYNSPEQQMQRLKEAGLNPHLVYGGGATTLSAPIRSSSASTPTMVAPHADMSGVSDAIGKYFAMKQTAAQTNNVEAMTMLAQKDAILKDALINKTVAETDATKYHLGTDKLLQDSQVYGAQLANKQKELSNVNEQQNIHINLQRNEREQLMNSTNIAKTLQEILTSKLQNTKLPFEKAQLQAMINHTNNEAELRHLDIMLRQHGAMPNDNAWWRNVFNFINQPRDTSYPYSNFKDLKW